MSAADRLLDHLQRVRQVKPGAWMAACPCCESRKGRPLAITESNDGRVLMHAFCGCSTADVLGRVGLEMSNLFDRPIAHAAEAVANKVPAGEVLRALDTEAMTLAMLAADFLENRALTEDDWNRLATAARRIGHANEYIHAGRK